VVLDFVDAVCPPPACETNNIGHIIAQRSR